MSRVYAFAVWIGALRGWRRFGLLLASGAAAGLSMPPVGFWPALFIAFPLFIWVLDGAAGRRTNFLLGWSFGFGYFAVSLHWIGFAFLVDAETYLWMMPFMVGGLAASAAIYWGLAAVAARLLWTQGIARISLLAASLAAAEWVRGHLLSGFPWAVPGLAADGMGGVLQVAAIAGMTGLTFLIVLWAGLPALLAGGRRGDIVAGVLVLAVLPVSWVWGSARSQNLAEPHVPGVALRIVQPNIPQSDKWRAENGRGIFEKLLAMSADVSTTAARPTHIVWPESAVPFLIDESPEALAAIDQLLPDGAMLIMGALRRERGISGEEQVFNSILGFDSLANLSLRYDKWRLVPGGEFLPFAWLLEPLGFRKVVTVPGSFTAGSGPVSLPVAGAPDAGFMICYEAVFPGHIADERAGWLVNVTNDGWFGRSAGPYQHLAQARMRAVEQGLPVVRAANTGISAVIDPAGRIVESLPLGGEGIIDAGLPTALGATPYVRFGDFVLVLLLGLGLAPTFVRNFGSQK